MKELEKLIEEIELLINNETIILRDILRHINSCHSIIKNNKIRFIDVKGPMKDTIEKIIEAETIEIEIKIMPYKRRGIQFKNINRTNNDGLGILKKISNILLKKTSKNSI